MNEILTRSLTDEVDEPMPESIELLFSWINEKNVDQTFDRIDEIIAHMRKLRTQWEDTDKPMKATSTAPEKSIDILKLVKPDGKSLLPIIPTSGPRMRR